MSAKITKRIRHGSWLAEVEVTRIPDDGAWGPYLSLEDVRKLERVSRALREGNIAAAAKDAQIFELHPVAAE